MREDWMVEDIQSRVNELYEKMYKNMYKNCEEGFLHILNTYIEFWSDSDVQEFHYDVSPVEVLNQVKNTVLTGEFDDRMVMDDEDG